MMSYQLWSCLIMSSITLILSYLVFFYHYHVPSYYHRVRTGGDIEHTHFVKGK
jgi:hypothetical protein